ncbi:MAG: M20/M25/M40 family metallo-hydrolase [Asgard group archaeon]|nr:M20/M25/M40 family metallo-hydrolase [Asgard group archaeon]
MSKSLEQLDEKSVVDLAKRLIKTQSLSGNEKKFATLLAIEMQKAGFTQVHWDDESNIVGVMPGLGTGKTLVLVGHIDTVPPGDMPDPFSAQETDGSKLGTKGKVIVGRGACDMKAAFAGMISASLAMKRARARLKGNYVVVGMSNSKNGKSIGLKEILKKFEIKADFVVSCAPTNLDINISHPGKAIFEIVTKGKMSNIGNPLQGDNAILKLAKVIECLYENAVLPEEKRYGKANMIISSISSEPLGESHSIPNLCKALLIRQYFKNESPEKIRDDFLELLKKNNYKEAEVSVQLERYYDALDTNPKEEIISVLQTASTIATGKEAKIGHWSSGVTISELLDVNIPIVGFGPGDEKFAHSPYEHVPVDQVIKAAKVYTVLAEKICVQMKDKSS